MDRVIDTNVDDEFDMILEGMRKKEEPVEVKPEVKEEVKVPEKA